MSTGLSDQGLPIVSLVKRHLIYSHDTYGLGHYRRCALLASALVQASDQNNVLIVTGSPRAESFSLPDRVDTVKLPAVTKNADGAYVPPTKNDDGGTTSMHWLDELAATIEGAA